jgi:chromosome segregation ATPase
MDDETIKRYMGVLVEQVTDQIKIVAEGHMMLVERFDRVDERLDGMDQRFDRIDQRFDQVDQRLDGMDQRLSTVEGELTAFRGEFHAFAQDVGRQFSEVRSMIKLSYAEIDGRITTLEKDLFDLRSRVERLEEKLLAS